MHRLLRKPILLSLVALLMASLVIVGCAGAAPTPMPTSTPRPGATPTPLPTATPVPVKPILMKVASYGPTPDYTHRWIQERAMDIILERSAGRIKFDYYPHETLIKVTEAFESVRNNVVQIGATFGIYEPERMGIVAKIETIPFKTWDPDKFKVHFREPGGMFEFMSPLWEKNGLKFLGWPVIPYGELYFREPVTKLEDMKGKLVRVPIPLAPLLPMLGATQTYLGMGDLYTGLQRRTIDGAAVTVSFYLSAKLYEVAPNMAQVHPYSGSIAYVMNLDFYNSLPPDIRKLIMDAYAEAEQLHYAKAIKTYEEEVAKVTAAGAKVWKPSKEEFLRWQQAAMPWFDQEIKQKFPAEWPQFQRYWDQLAYIP